MVSSEKSNFSRVSDFVRHEEFESFDRIISSVNKITHKDVGCVWNVSSLVEELKKVVKLSMDVPAYCNRG
jgi:hypothetical protein